MGSTRAWSWTCPSCNSVAWRWAPLTWALSSPVQTRQSCHTYDCGWWLENEIVVEKFSLFCVSEHKDILFQYKLVFSDNIHTVCFWNKPLFVRPRGELHGQLRAAPAPYPLQKLAHRGSLWQEIQTGLLWAQRSIHQQWLQGGGKISVSCGCTAVKHTQGPEWSTQACTIIQFCFCYR